MFVYWRAQLRAPVGGWSRTLLLSMGLIDELIAGIPIVALPLLRDRLGITYAQIGLLFTVATLSGMLFDPLINLLSDRKSKKIWIISGLVLLAGSYLLMGTANSFGLLMLAFIISFPAGGAAIGLAQTVVIDAAPSEGPRTMTRWTLLSSIGDFAAPLVVALFVGLRLGWVQLCLLAAALWLAAAVACSVSRFPARAPAPRADVGETGASATSVWERLREAVRDRNLLRWTALSMLPTMLDEVFLGFVVLYLRDSLRANEGVIALIVAVQMASSVASLLVLDRVLKHRHIAPARLLMLLALATLVGVVGLLLVQSLWLAGIALAIISAGCAGWYPLATAEAYAQRPDSSGVVLTVMGLGTPFEMALPGVVGLISANSGLRAGLAVLGLAPLLMLALLPRRVTTAGGERRALKKAFVEHEQ